MRHETKEQRYWRNHWENTRFNDEVATVFGTVQAQRDELHGIQQKLQRDLADAAAIKQAERQGNTTQANALRARMAARNLGVHV